MASLSDVVQAIGQVVVDALDDAGLIVLPDPVFYHGAIPDDSECQDGRVSCWWTSLTGTDRFPSPAASIGCSGPPMMDVRVRWTRCWPITPAYSVNQSDLAVVLSDGAWAVHSKLLELACTSVDLPPELSRSGFALMQTDVKTPQGGTAGIDWRIRCRPLLGPGDLAG